MTARIVFYFHIAKNIGMVLNPDEIEGGPEWDLSPLSAAGKRVVLLPKPRPTVAERRREVSESDLTLLRTKDKNVVILDVGSREEFAQGHHKEAVNIPIEELLVRATIELRRDGYVVVDCRRNPPWYSQAGLLLNSIGFGRVLLLMP